MRKGIAVMVILIWRERIGMRIIIVLVFLVLFDLFAILVARLFELSIGLFYRIFDGVLTLFAAHFCLLFVTSFHVRFNNNCFH